MTKQMDLREALAWCYQNMGDSLKVLSTQGDRPVQIKMGEGCRMYGQYPSGSWEPVKSWWVYLTHPDTKFQIPEECTLPPEISKAIDSLEGICDKGKSGVRRLVKEILEAKVKP